MLVLCFLCCCFFLISHLTSWPVRTLSIVHKIRKYFTVLFGLSPNRFHWKILVSLLPAFPTHLHENNQLLPLLLGYILVTDYFSGGCVTAWDTPKQAVCMFFSSVSADNHQGRRVKRRSAILYHPPAVLNTWWNHAVETLEENVYSALQDKGGEEERRKTGREKKEIKRRRWD